jgi:hypothetical protein
MLGLGPECNFLGPFYGIGSPDAQFDEFSKVPEGFSKLCSSMENAYQKLIHQQTRLDKTHRMV